MADSMNSGGRALNPWVLHVQKLGLELKCPLCLNLFSWPLLLPCDHIFCNSCIPRSAQFGSECPICKSQCLEADLRSLPLVENIVSIYRGLNSFSGANLIQSVSSAARRVLDQCPSQEDNSSNDQSVTTNKLGQALVNHSVGGGKSKGFEMPSARDNEHNGGQDPDSSWPSSQLQGGDIRGCRFVQIDMNRVEQTSLGSPPFDDVKGSDNESSDQGSKHSPQNYSANRPIKRSFDDRRSMEQHGWSASETESHLTDFKRLKKLDHGNEHVGVQSAGHTQSMILESESLMTSNSELEHDSGVPLANATVPTISDDSHTNKFICGFCQSCRISEATGPMLHYSNGNLVVGSEAAGSNVIHVHSKCIEWAPQVYYAGETVKNLKAELSRGSKLKCSKCGLKGAALGCYVKSCRRSYHVPCALEIPKCRWDYEDFLLLCPGHFSVKFPSEKSGKCILKDNTVPLQITPQQSNFWGALPGKAKEWVFCGSALSSEEKLLLVRFGTMIGVTVSKFWKPNVTHVIAATDANGACTRTLKVLMAIVNGFWVLRIDWIKACMKAMHPVAEEPYEVSLDNHGCRDGPKTGRLRPLEKAPKLFDGLSFYFSGDFMPGYKEDLQSLVFAAGGTVWKSEVELLAQGRDNVAAPSKTLVVYNLDSPEGSQLGEEVSIIWKRLNEAEDLASKIGSQVIGHTWLLESIAAHKLQPLVS